MFFSILYFFILQVLQSASLVYSLLHIRYASKSSVGVFSINLIICATQWYFLVVIISYWNFLGDREEEERARETDEPNEMGVHSHNAVRKV